METLELKSIITEIKNALDWLNSKFKMKESMILKIYKVSNLNKREKRLTKVNRVSGTHESIIKDLAFILTQENVELKKT